MFQYPLADRLGFWGAIGVLYLRWRAQFQYPLADRLGFWGPAGAGTPTRPAGFSILLRIDLVFGVISPSASIWTASSFSILLRIDLVFGEFATIAEVLDIQVSVSSCGSTWFLGRQARNMGESLTVVSVSSCGSTWFLGDETVLLALFDSERFSILLRIDLVFGAANTRRDGRAIPCFSILLRIDLVFGAASSASQSSNSFMFQYPLADRLGFWGRRAIGCWRRMSSGFSILLRIDLVFGDQTDEQRAGRADVFQYPLADRLGFWGRRCGR